MTIGECICLSAAAEWSTSSRLLPHQHIPTHSNKPKWLLITSSQAHTRTNSCSSYLQEFIANKRAIKIFLLFFFLYSSLFFIVHCNVRKSSSLESICRLQFSFSLGFWARFSAFMYAHVVSVRLKCCLFCSADKHALFDDILHEKSRPLSISESEATANQAQKFPDRQQRHRRRHIYENEPVRPRVDNNVCCCCRCYTRASGSGGTLTLEHRPKIYILKFNAETMITN